MLQVLAGFCDALQGWPGRISPLLLLLISDYCSYYFSKVLNANRFLRTVMVSAFDHPYVFPTTGEFRQLYLPGLPISVEITLCGPSEGLWENRSSETPVLS